MNGGTKMENKNGVKETYLQKVKRGLQEKLFNSEILSRPDVTGVELARIAGTSQAQLYRWFKKFGFETQNHFANKKEPSEIQDIIWQTLTCDQAERLYTWAKGKRFAKRKVPAKRAYHLTDEGRRGRAESRKRTKEDQKKDIAKNKQLIANMGIPSISAIPDYNHDAAQQSISDKLHDFITTNESTDAQVDNLINHILLAEPAQTEAVGAMAKMLRQHPEFNAQQWAFEEMCKRSGETTVKAFLHSLNGVVPNVDQADTVNKLTEAYRSNQSKINLDRVSEGGEKE